MASTSIEGGVDAMAAAGGSSHVAFVDAMSAGVVFQRAARDEAGRIVDFVIEYANEAFAQIVGHPRADMVGKRFRELSPAWADALFDTYVEAVETGQSRTIDTRPGRFGPGHIPAHGRDPVFEIRVARLGDGCSIRVTDVTDERHAEDELFRSQEMLRSVLDTFPQRVFWKDLDSTFVGCNAAFARHLGLSDPSEIVGKTDFEIHAPSDAEMYRADDHEIMQSGRARIEYEEPMRSPDGTEGWAKTSKVPIRDKHGEVIGILGATRDITEEKRAREALRESERFLDSVVENIPVMVFVKDAQTLQFVRVNKAGERMLGHPRERLIDQDTSGLVPAEEEEHFNRHDRLVATTGQPVEIPEEVITNPVEGKILMHTVKVPIFGPDGKPRYVLGISEDITARKAAEEARREIEDQYRRILDGITNYIVSVRIEDSQVVSASHGAGSVAVTGYSPEELSADKGLWNRLVVPDDREFVEENMLRVLAGIRIPPIEHRIRRKDGAVRWIRQTLVLRFDADGNLDGYNGVVQDITESRTLQDQLLQAQKMEGIGRLAGGVAHDFNNLLTAILGYVEICRMDLPSGLPPEHPARQDLKEIAAAGERAASLTRQLLTFANRQPVALVRLDLRTHVTDSMKMLQRLLGDDVEIETSLAPDLRTVLADPGQIQQLLVNLTVNARDAMPHGGHLFIDVANERIDADTAKAHPGVVAGPHVLLAVADTGQGMSEEVRSRVFEPFFTTKEMGKGTGLGLAICHGIVKQLSGFVEVISEPGHGSVFRIHLPSQEGPADRLAFEPGSAPNGTETVLVVEDEEPVRRLVVLGLRARGYRVLEAANGAQALELARAEDGIDMIVSDVMMPGMNGPALVRELATLVPRARALLMSGHADAALLDEAPEWRQAFVAKPFTPERLARKVREILDEPVWPPERAGE